MRGGKAGTLGGHKGMQLTVAIMTRAKRLLSGDHGSLASATTLRMQQEAEGVDSTPGRQK